MLKGDVIILGNQKRQVLGKSGLTFELGCVVLLPLR